MKHKLDDSCHFLAEVVRNSGELSFDDLFIKALHVICSERRHQGTHFVEDTTEGPNITLAIVGLVAPYLWAGIIRSARLRIAEALLDNFRDIEVTKCSLHVFKEEEVRTFHVSMENAPDVEGS